MSHDSIDLNILNLIQHDATMPLGRIADRVGLSQTPCWKRIKKLERSGAIRRRVAVLDAEALGLGQTAFLIVQAQDQTREWRAAFCDAVLGLPAVVEVHRLTGHHDFLVKLIAPDAAALDRLVEDLTARIPMRSCEILASAERMMETTAIPLAQVSGGRTSDRRPRDLASS